MDANTHDITNDPVLTLSRFPHHRIDDTISGVICPGCFRPVKMAEMTRTHHFCGIGLRHYFGHCDSCRAGCEVYQFYHDGLWKMYKVRQMPFGGAAGRLVEIMPLPVSDFTTKDTKKHEDVMNSVANDPVLMMGPDGDYTQEVTDAQLEKFLEQATIALNRLGHIVMDVAGILRARKTNREIFRQD